MTIAEYIERLKAFRGKVIARTPEFAARQVMDANALLQTRIINRGENSEGSTLGHYTNEDYINKRAKRGRQTLYVDLTFTRGGAGMFGSTGLIYQSTPDDLQANGTFKAVVGGRDEFTQKKLSWNSDRYGNVLALNKAETKLITDSFDTFLLELAKESGL